MPAESKCEIIRPLLSDYVDGETGGADAVRVESHLSGCPACASHLAFLRAVNFALSDPPESLPPARMHARIAALTYSRPTVSSRVLTWARSLTPGRVAFGLGGAVAVAVVAAVTLSRPVSVSPGVATTDAPAAPAAPAPVANSGSVNGGNDIASATPEGSAEGTTAATGTAGSVDTASPASTDPARATGSAASVASAAPASGVTSPRAPQAGPRPGAIDSAAGGRRTDIAMEGTTARPLSQSPRGGINGGGGAAKPAVGIRPARPVATVAKTGSGNTGAPKRGSGSGVGAPVTTPIKPIFPPSTVPGVSEGANGGSIASVAVPEPKLPEPEPAAPTSTPAPTAVASRATDPVYGDVNAHGRIRLTNTQKVSATGIIRAGSAHDKPAPALDPGYSLTDGPGGKGNVVTAPVQ